MATAPDGRVLSPGEVYTDSSLEPTSPQSWHDDLGILLICPDCRENPPILVEERSSGDTVCGSCGRVLADRLIDTSSEWRTFSNDDAANDDPSRVGDAANPLLMGSQLHTDIAFEKGKGRMGMGLAAAQNKANSNKHDKLNKGLTAAYASISAYCDTVNLTKTVADTAKYVYKSAMEGTGAREFRGRSQKAVIASCIFVACRQQNVSRTFKEIQELTGVRKKELGRIFKELERHLAGRNQAARERGKGREKEKERGVGASSAHTVTNTFQPTQSTSPAELVSRACSNLSVPASVALMAREIATKIHKLGIAAGRSPLSISGAVVYLTTHFMGHGRTPRQVSETAGVSEGALRTTYKIVRKAWDRIVEEEWVERGGDVERLPVS
jgi:transcription initiation factor TFIIB